MPNAEILIPWLPGCPHRERALEWVLARHTYPVTVAEGSRPWRKGAAINRAVRESSADVLVIADADTWTDGLDDAICAAEVAGWAVPHLRVRRLSEEATEAVYGGAELCRGLAVEEHHEGVAGGGFVVAQRAVFDQVPMDPRFTGWGQEDDSWGRALRCLFGPPWRGRADLYHLWHPQAQRVTRSRGSRENWALRKRYVLAQHDQGKMRRLLEEVRNGDPELAYAAGRDNAA